MLWSEYKDEKPLLSEEEKEAYTMHIWYTDEELTDYINSAALDYEQAYGVKVVPVRVEGGEYLEGINHSTMSEADDFPDLFVISNDSLEKAAVAGLASRLSMEEEWFVQDNFPETSARAVTWEEHLLAYPFYFETSFLLYNRSLLQETAKQLLIQEMKNEAAMNTGDESEDGNASEPVQDENAVWERTGAIMPSTIEDIMNFANDYDLVPPIETVFKWDVSDIFYNYFFAGNYLNVGGLTGDDSSIVDIYNTDAMTCLLWYQQLNQFFSIEADAVDYDSVMEEFIGGKVLFTIATTDAVERLETAKKNGEFAYDYAVAPLPGVTDELASRGLNVTSCIVVNEYSLMKEDAARFAKALVYGNANSLYSRTGRMAAYRDQDNLSEVQNIIMSVYEQSVPLPKMMLTSNYWVLLEQCYTSVWIGEDVNESLRKLSEQMKMQIAGEKTEEKYLETPTLETADEN